jgi:threonine/homoserine/homoserine lactone efflux protein
MNPDPVYFDLMPLANYLAYLAAAMVCIAAPGPDSLTTVSVAASQGRRAGSLYGIGVGLGCLTHTLWATLGIAAVIAASATLFAAIKWVGIAYLVYLGVQAWRAGGASLPERASAGAQSALKLLSSGFLMNALNPKVMLFFLAFLPQFIDPAHPVTPQMLLMGLSFALITGTAYGLLGWGAGSAARRLLTNLRFARIMNRVTGSLFLSLAVAMAVSDRK